MFAQIRGAHVQCKIGPIDDFAPGNAQVLYGMYISSIEFCCNPNCRKSRIVVYLQLLNRTR